MKPAPPSPTIPAPTRRPGLPAVALLLVALCGPLACAEPRDDGPEPTPGAPALALPDDTWLVELVHNGGFEWIADATTEPPKYGAYWLDAFSSREGDPFDRVEEDPRAPEGRRVLRLQVGGASVSQKLVTDPRWTEHLRVSLAVRAGADAAVSVTLRDGLDREFTAWTHPDAEPDTAELGDGWTLYTLDLGRRFEQRHGARPQPRMVLELGAIGTDGAAVDVDAVSAAAPWPRVDAADLGARLEDLVRETLRWWYAPPDDGGLQMIDPATGYVTTLAYDVETGRRAATARSVGLHTLHTLLVDWIALARRRGWSREYHWRQHDLARIVRTLLERNFDPQTQLPRTVTWPELEPNDHTAVTVGAYVDFLLDAREVLDDAELGELCLAQARRTADALLALHAAHDLPPDRFPNDVKLAPDGSGTFVGEMDNWFGFLPNKITPKGEIDTPARFNTAWAIVSGRTFWYHLFKSPAAVVRVHAAAPREGDLVPAHRSIARFHRDWDAARYDLENDTDDHYGYLTEDVLPMLRHGGIELPDALALVQEATDHRLPRRVTERVDDEHFAREATVDDALWIQAVRLGTACAGDSPRAFEGVLELFELPPAINPVSSGLPLYRDAILELAWNDFKGRQLTNGQFTESFFKDWEMVCICYRGTVQADCRTKPADYWHGDVGDIFGGPPGKSIEALTHAYRVAAPRERALLLSAMGIIEHVTEASLRREYGYVFGLDPAVARQYELPEKYTLGLNTRTTAGVGYVMSWLKLLPHLDVDTEPYELDPAIAPHRPLGR